jgi:hypothetical protein
VIKALNDKYGSSLGVYEEPYHHSTFIADSKKRLIELDGRKASAIVISKNCNDLLTGSIEELSRRYAANEIEDTYSVMVLIRKRNTKET